MVTRSVSQIFYEINESSFKLQQWKRIKLLTDGITGSHLRHIYLVGVFREKGFPIERFWAKWLSLAKWWYNTTFHSSLGKSPGEALYGFPPTLHIPYIPKDTTDKDVVEFIQDREAVVKVLKKSLSKAKNRMK